MNPSNGGRGSRFNEAKSRFQKYKVPKNSPIKLFELISNGATEKLEGSKKFNLTDIAIIRAKNMFDNGPAIETKHIPKYSPIIRFLLSTITGFAHPKPAIKNITDPKRSR